MAKKQKTTRKSKKYQYLTTTLDQAKDIFAITFEHNILGGLESWYQKVRERIEPDFDMEGSQGQFENYSINQLLHPDCDIKGIGKCRYVRILALFAFLTMLLDDSWEIYGATLQENPKQAWDFDPLSEECQAFKQLVETVDISLLQSILYETLIVVTGEEYMELFTEKISQTDLSDEEIIKDMEANPEIAKYSNIIGTYGTFKAFIDSTFFFFKNIDQLKSTK